MSEEVAAAAGDIAHQQRQAAAAQAAKNIAEARQIVTAASQLAWSLYVGDQLSAEQHEPISLAIDVAEMGIKHVEELNDELQAARATIDRQRRVIEQAQERERIAASAYEQQQTSYRELEGLYHDAQQNYLNVLRTNGEVAVLNVNLLADNAALLEIALRAGQVQTYEQGMADVAALKAEHPGTTLLAERQHLLRIALAAWKISEEVSEFGQPVSSETVEALDQALLDAFGDTYTNWYAVRDKIKALLGDSPPLPPGIVDNDEQLVRDYGDPLDPPPEAPQ